MGADSAIETDEEFPGTLFYFLPADMVTQILNFGLPAPIDIQIEGNNVAGNRRFADQLLAQLRPVSGVVDLRIQQPFDQPKLHITVDRTKAAQAGLTQRDVASSLLVSLSGSFQTTPTFWLNPVNGVNYNVVTRSPEYRITSLQDLQNIPISSPNAPAGDSGRRRHDLARLSDGGCESLQSAPRTRHLRIGGRPRPWIGG